MSSYSLGLYCFSKHFATVAMMVQLNVVIHSLVHQDGVERIMGAIRQIVFL